MTNTSAALVKACITKNGTCCLKFMFLSTEINHGVFFSATLPHLAGCESTN